jgi:hypothetical protein
VALSRAACLRWRNRQRSLGRAFRLPKAEIARLDMWAAAKFGATTITITHDMFVADTLEEIRMLLPPGLCCFGRRDSDDPVIVEVWL